MMGMNKSMHGGMNGPPSNDAPPSEEAPSVFLTKEALGGRALKPGDSITMRVKDVDPETGDIEATLEGPISDQDERPGYERNFDAAMPMAEGEM